MRAEKPARRNLTRIRTVVADDEPLARELMQNLVRRDRELELVAITASGAETLSAIEQYAPQLVLLDIQMPNLDGISVAEQLASQPAPPYIIYVTAHDAYALRAFEVAVRDYLVKPVGKRRFASAIRRAKADIRGRSGESPETHDDSLILRSGETLHSVMADDIVWIAAANQYACLHTVGGDEYVVSQSLRQFVRTLPEQDFTRIHRSTVINHRHMQSLQTIDGRIRVEMSDGSVHDLARNRKALVPELLRRIRQNSLL